jgi:hypothetical protein
LELLSQSCKEFHVHTNTELMVKFSRRGLWLALALLLALGAYAVIVNFYPDSGAALLANRMALLLPLAIVIAVAGARSSLKSMGGEAQARAAKAVQGDELRQHSLRLAYRNGLLAVLGAQPVLALLLDEKPVLLMAAATAMTGVLAVLVSLLAYDR